ncbi:GNAT family N-acetyltransferase [Marivita hallyeonensis]|uniref:L-amino acid N-acyltransferase YncA n=1 Tax=Marivita hallyeonensis TaxID=996342 RepID=A0A1M5WAI8_9RHOB|nr:GNAT family N-acetyltransferase [Marivita hallyeonensis]SHH84589.1 L-amino acid N-acyltransferase YncA [Marivita hallyeonensis]
MTIRRLTPKDLSAYRAIWAEGLMRVPTAFLFGAEEVRAIPNKDIEKALQTHLTFGAFDEASRIQGFISARRGGPRRMRHMADIGPLYVRDTAQGQGLGRALVEAMLQELARNGVLQAELCVDVENTRAQALYKSMGFHVFGRRPRSVLVDGGPRDDFLMIRALDETDLTRDA